MDEINNQSNSPDQGEHHSASPIPPATISPNDSNHLVRLALPNGKSLGSLIFGIISLIIWVYPYGGFVASGLGLYLGIRGRKISRKKLATAGITLCLIGLVLSATNLLFYYLYVNVMDDQTAGELSNSNASTTDALVVGNSILAPTSLPWQEFTSTSSGFSILLPTTPKKQTQNNIPIIGTKMTYNVETYTAGNPDTVYLITVETYPIKISNEDPKPILQSAVDEMVKNGAGAITSSSFGDFGANKSLDFALEGGITSLTFKGKVILTTRKIYLIMTRAPASKLNDSDYKKYVNSLKIK